MSSGGPVFVLGGLSALFLLFTKDESNSANFGNTGDADPATQHAFIFDAHKNYVANVTNIKDKSSIVLVKLFFFTNVEELYWVFSA